MESLKVLYFSIFCKPSARSSAAVSSPSFSMPAPSSSTAATGPGLYADIGRRVDDLLYKDFRTDHVFILKTAAVNGMANFSSSFKEDEAISGEIKGQINYEKMKVLVRATTDGQVFLSTRTESIGFRGLNTICMAVLPYQTAGKVDLQFLHDYAGIGVGLSLTTTPLLNFSALLGSKNFSVGADVGYDTSNGVFTKYDAGVRLRIDDLLATILVNNKGESITASYFHLMMHQEFSVGAELTYKFSNCETTGTFGLQHWLDSQTSLKLRYDSKGVASGLIQHELGAKSVWTISAEMDTKAINKGPKVGLMLVINP